MLHQAKTNHWAPVIVIVTLATASWACTSAVAPMNEGGTAASGLAGATGGVENSGNATGTGGGTANGGGIATGSGTGEGTGTGTGTTTASKSMGKISETSGDLDFKPKNAYALYSDLGATKSLMFYVTEGDVNPDSYREPKKWECKACPNNKCETSSTTAPHVKTITLMLMNMGTTVNLDANGFPSTASYDRATPGDSMSGVILSYSPAALTTWTGGNEASAELIKFDPKPASLGDDFKMIVDAKFVEAATAADWTGAKTWKGTVEGKVVKMYSPPADLICKDTEYKNPVFE